MTEKAFTPTGLKIEGQYENERNRLSSGCFKDVIREAFGVDDVIVAHHLTYVKTDNRDGFSYEVVQEIPSADCLLFDHEIARHIWGEGFLEVLKTLATTPTEDRDRVFHDLYYQRRKDNAKA